jgi:hypothetical protein
VNGSGGGNWRLIHLELNLAACDHEGCTFGSLMISTHGRRINSPPGKRGLSGHMVRGVVRDDSGLNPGIIVVHVLRVFEAWPGCVT